MFPILAFFVLHWLSSVFFQTFFLHRYGAHKQFLMSPAWERRFYFMTFLTQGSESILLAGLCFGLATIPKYTTGIYALTMMAPVGIVYDISSALGFAIASGVPFIIANLIDAKLGFWDSEARKQITAAHSSADPMRRSGVGYRPSIIGSAASPKAASPGVGIMSGATQFTRIARSPSSTASVWVNCCTAAFIAA